jgi:hypothetical protein
MEPDRRRLGFWPIPLAASVLLWPAIWNGYPIVFADTGTYLSQAIHLYLGWDRPPFYSLFILPLHMTISTWPIVGAQALLAGWVLLRVVRIFLPAIPARWLPLLVLPLATTTWLPFLVSELTPDLFTPLMVLVLCVLALAPPDSIGWHERWCPSGVAAFMAATQQSSVALALVLVPILLIVRRMLPARCGILPQPHLRQATTIALLAPPLLAMAALFAVNLVGHGRAALSPFGNVFVLARVIYDGPGMAVLSRDCPASGWRLCAYRDKFPPSSDEFLWRPDSPVMLAGGHKAVSAEAGAIIAAALRAEPVAELRAVFGNAVEQVSRFASGDGLEAWPAQVGPWIERDFPAFEGANYRAGRQAQGLLAVPPWLQGVHEAMALAGVAVCLLLLPLAVRRRHRAAGLLLAVLAVLPISALITGGLSTPHDRYQSRVMWLAPLVAALSTASLVKRRA